MPWLLALTIAVGQGTNPAPASAFETTASASAAAPTPTSPQLFIHAEQPVDTGTTELPTPAAASPAPISALVTAPRPSSPDRWLVMKALQGTWPGALLDENRLQISGWTDMSFTASTADESNSPMGFNYRANQFLLQQNWLRLERRVVTDGIGPSIGFRNDWILPGSDYVFTLPRGIFNSQLAANNGAPIRTGIDPIQFYLEAYFPNIGRGMDVKFGRFFAQYGVESNAAVDNYFLSHAYAFIFDPFTHTGLLTTTRLTDAWSVQAGMVIGCDNFIGPTDTPTFTGSIKYADPAGRNSFLFATIIGPARFNVGQNFHNPDVFDMIYTHKFNPRLNYTLETLYGLTSHVPNIGFANWLSVINYLGYEFTPRLTGATRVEFFDDFQGQRTGFKGLYCTWTAGLQFRLRKSIIFRPELRYDYNTESGPFEGKHGLFTAASDIIVRW
jgi:putative OmpL-like beta-barrel porin-2